MWEPFPCAEPVPLTLEHAANRRVARACGRTLDMLGDLLKETSCTDKKQACNAEGNPLHVAP